MKDVTLGSQPPDGLSAALSDVVNVTQLHGDMAAPFDHELGLSFQCSNQPRDALVAPVDHLYPEILSEIFYAYAEDYDELFSLRWTRLLLVCRRWHDIALNTQSLWSFMNIGCAVPIGELSHPDIHALDSTDIRRIETQRARAWSFPLTLKMRLYSPISDAKVALATTITR